MNFTHSLLQNFEQSYGAGAQPAVFFCPGRVNLIGEHIDYNGGPVFPAAISQGIYAAVRFTSSGVVRLRSVQRSESIEIPVDKLPPFTRDSATEVKDWIKYPLGMLASLKATQQQIPSADILFASDLPIGAGVSSSAAIEVLTGFIFLSGPNGAAVDRTALALRALGVEREFVGVNCGVMDQFSVAQGKRGHAILLDCATLEFRYVPFNLAGLRLVVMNTNKPRELAGSKYNERRAECETALGLINATRVSTGLPERRDLCSCTVAEVQECVTDPIMRRRAFHVVSETRRVAEAVAALERGNVEAFGRLMSESHASLKNDYEVTGPELDAIVAAAQVQSGCLGARMTGAGFGGCAIALVRESEVEQFNRSVADEFHAKTGLHATFFGGDVTDGVGKCV